MYTSTYFCPNVVFKQLTLVAAGAIASRVSGLSFVTSKSTHAEKKELFVSGRMASGHLLLISHAHMHAQTQNSNLGIMI